MNENKPIEIQRVDELPPEVLVPLRRDAAEFRKLYEKHGSEWLCETLALFKYQVEGAHSRIDELQLMVSSLMHQMHNLPRIDISLDRDDEDSGTWEEDPDWWKKS